VTHATDQPADETRRQRTQTVHSVIEELGNEHDRNRARRHPIDRSLRDGEQRLPDHGEGDRFAGAHRRGRRHAEAISGLVAAGAAGHRGASRTLRAIITTHRHWDHIRALPAASAKYPGCDDDRRVPKTPQRSPKPREWRSHTESTTSTSGTSAASSSKPSGIAWAHSRGRSRCCCATEDIRSCSPVTRCSPAGRARPGPRDDFTSLMDDLEERVFAALPDDTLVLPGHGALDDARR
jgi:hypothetical protein